MSVAARRPDPDVTQGGDERMSERASETARVLPIRPDLAPDSRARTRYHGPRPSDKDNKRSKVRNFVQPHLADVKAAPELAWLTQQRPQSIAEIAAGLIPSRAEAGNPAVWVAKVVARLFKLAVHCAAYTACAATQTDKRAAMAAALFTLTLAVAFAAHQYGA